MIRRVLILIMPFILGLAVCSQGSAAKPQTKARALMLTESRGFHHGSVRRPKTGLAPAEVAMTQLGQQTGLFEVHCTQDCEADFTKENLKNYDLVMFYTTGVLPISDETRDYFLNDWLKQKGHGFLGFHSATDTYNTTKEEHRWYQDLIGGTFRGHPWNSRNTVTISVHDSNHPGMKPFGKEFQIKDEIYEYVNWKPENVRVLMSLNMEACKPKRPYHVPVAWAKEWGAGKVFYTNLGHNGGTWTDPRFLKSTEGAVRWILNLEEGDATPNPDVSAAEEENAKQAAAE
jgi:hypothetical protein